MNREHAKRVLAHQERQQMLISTAFPSKFLKAVDLSGEATTVTITVVTMEQVAKSGDPQPVVHFKEFQQGMVLNKTNAKAITKLYGDDTNRWKGQKIELFEAMVEYQGDVMPALRVRQPKSWVEPKNEAAFKAPWEDEFEHPVKLSTEALNKVRKPKNDIRGTEGTAAAPEPNAEG